MELDFGSDAHNKKVRKMMIPAVRKALTTMLSGSMPKVGLSFVQMGNATTTTNALGVNEISTPVAEGVSVPSAQWKKCTTDAKVNCGALHDTMSLQWGKFKDDVETLSAKMDKNDDEWDQLKGTINEQMDISRQKKDGCQSQLAAATSAENMLHEEKQEKTDEQREIKARYDHKMAECRAR